MTTNGIKRTVCKCLYRIAKHLPKSHSRINIGQKRIRRALARGFVDYVGKNVNIEKMRLSAIIYELETTPGLGSIAKSEIMLQLETMK